MSDHEPMTWWREGDKLLWANEKGEISEAPSDHWKIGELMYHLCMFTKFRKGEKVYRWQPRKPNPVACPRCRYRFDNPFNIVERK